MKKFRVLLRKFFEKNGSIIAGCAFVFVTLAANSSCITAFFEPEEPNGLENFKKFNN